jgi:hypothetical protein
MKGIRCFVTALTTFFRNNLININYIAALLVEYPTRAVTVVEPDTQSSPTPRFAVELFCNITLKASAL